MNTNQTKVILLLHNLGGMDIPEKFLCHFTKGDYLWIPKKLLGFSMTYKTEAAFEGTRYICRHPALFTRKQPWF